MNPGDPVVADECGVLVQPPAGIEAATERAICMHEAENRPLKRLKAGEKTPDIQRVTALIGVRLREQ